jgi:hypothetical protein
LAGVTDDAEAEGDALVDVVDVCRIAAEKDSSGGLRAAPTDFLDGFESNSVWALAMIGRAEVDLFLGDTTESDAAEIAELDTMTLSESLEPLVVLE